MLTQGALLRGNAYQATSMAKQLGVHKCLLLLHAELGARISLSDTINDHMHSHAGAWEREP